MPAAGQHTYAWQHGVWGPAVDGSAWGCTHMQGSLVAQAPIVTTWMSAACAGQCSRCLKQQQLPKFVVVGWKLSCRHAPHTLRMGFTSQRQACPANARRSRTQAHLCYGPLGADVVDVALPGRPGQAVLCCHLPPGSLLHGSSVGNHILPAPVSHHQLTCASTTS